MFSALQRNDRSVLLVPATMALCYFLLSGSETFWTRTMQKCQAFDTKISIVARIDCCKSVVDYILVAVTIFAGTYVIAAFLRDRTGGSGRKQQGTNIGHIKIGKVELVEPSGIKISSTLEDGSKDYLS
jgi:hypothetical protein